MMMSGHTLIRAVKSWQSVKLLILKINDDVTHCNAEL